jgi:hypothetical protein
MCWDLRHVFICTLQKAEGVAGRRLCWESYFIAGDAQGDWRDAIGKSSTTKSSPSRAAAADAVSVCCRFAPVAAAGTEGELRLGSWQCSLTHQTVESDICI